MKERPIIFSGPMVRAILEGRKTQTRRLIKLRHGADVVVVDGRVWKPARVDYAGFVDCPYGQPGDRLWVRETFCPDWCEKPIYKADGGSAIDAGYSREPKWKPSIFMPRAASRITLEVTGVRVERIQDISDADAQAEGVERYGRGWKRYFFPVEPHSAWEFPVNSFASLWDSINLVRAPWASNPWVWVIEFKRVTP